MSETRDDTGNEPQDVRGDEPPAPGTSPGEVDLEALEAEGGDPEEDGLDVSDLEAMGVDGVVARLRSASGEDDDATTAKARPRRSPLISMVVVVFGVYLLVTMLADFRYWLRSGEPVELGHASTLLQDGRTLEAYENQYVAIEGTPDVQHATRLTTEEQFIGYLRVTEGDGGLFAAVPRAKSEEVNNNFEGRYVGRLRRLGEDRAYQWLAEFYATERVTRSIDLEARGAVEAVGSGRLPTLEGGAVDVRPSDQLRLVFEGPDARVQLGRSSFADEAAAERAVAALGHPYVQLPASATFFRFVVRIPEAERPKAQAALNAGLTGVEDSTDPKVGAFVLDLPANYGAAVGDVTLDGDSVVFPYGDNTASPGHDVEGGRLIERAPSDRMSLPLAQLASVRLERIITVDPEGFVVAVGETPGDQLRAGLLWLLVLAITGANIGSLVLWWRRRAA
ncbi:hypothetical protein [Paraliomyxa miuraensis]|uniref:hypothetical protein n=1 Tax=Paraliomyxa miuraensis TaxID=376150 RepID=UPI00225A0FB7|nr:hypothetical protein [Paraliomyxa miuraensis]MCX4242880.1 hypothetical protein [Paraliomyxa miuraensis]